MAPFFSCALFLLHPFLLAPVSAPNTSHPEPATVCHNTTIQSIPYSDEKLSVLLNFTTNQRPLNQDYRRVFTLLRNRTLNSTSSSSDSAGSPAGDRSSTYLTFLQIAWAKIIEAAFVDVKVSHSPDELPLPVISSFTAVSGYGLSVGVSHSPDELPLPVISSFTAVSAYGLSVGVLLFIIMLSMVECTRVTSINKQGQDQEISSPEYNISGEVDGKIVQWGPGAWMRPLGDVEIMFAIGGFCSSLNTVQAIWLKTDQPLNRQLVRDAMEQLTQRIPILNVCIQFRGARLWYRRVKKTVIDFDVVLHGDTQRVFDEVQSGTYSLREGPLWRARMVVLPPNEASPRGEVAENHVMVVFGVQHSVTDATTNLILCKELVSILNDMLQDRPISSKPYPLSAPHAEKLVDTSRSYLIKYFCKRFFNVLILDFNKKTTFRGLLPLPRNYTVETKILKHIFSEDLTTKLIRKCKENSTTVHSCIVSAANATYLDVASRKTEENIDSVSIYYTDSINLRRYYPKQEREYIGCHITMHEQKTVMSTDGKANFWSTARCSRAALHEDLSRKVCLNIIPIIKWVAIVFPLNIARNMKGWCNVTDSHYITTNMGDVTKIVGSTDPADPVQVTDIFRSASGEQAGHLFTLTCHTFRKRFYLSIDYYANKMSDEQANEFFDDLKEKLISLAESGNI